MNEEEAARPALLELPLRLYESRTIWLTVLVGATILGAQKRGWSWVASLGAGMAVLLIPVFLSIALLILSFVWAFSKLLGLKLREEGIAGVATSTYRVVLKPILFGRRGSARSPKSGSET